MPVEDFIIITFCFVEEELKKIERGRNIRQRGFQPKLSDAEVITMEIIGEYLGIDCDKWIWQYFMRHWLSWFPNLGSRENFVRQATNLWYYKQQMQKNLSDLIGGRTDNIHMIDGFPVPVCRYKRARRCKRFKGEATFGYCASKSEHYYGFHGHLLVSFDGIISHFSLTRTTVDEREAMLDMTEHIHGLLIGDKGYISQEKKEYLFQNKRIDLQTPLRDNMKETRDLGSVKRLMDVRRKIETVIGQLSEQFKIEKVRAKDLWHLMHRMIRKLLSHTMGVLINKLLGRDPLHFDGLIQA
jgi:hypothetical protein